MPTAFALLLSLLSCCSCCIASIVNISSLGDFINFSNNVSSGTNYFGTTVRLCDDIDMANFTDFEPIGNNYDNYFNGTFDGQGYVISNLFVNSSSEHVGLFGRSTNLTVRNVVFDRSCSFVGSYENDDGGSFIGGVIGHCEGEYKINNIVNMADVTFDGNVGYLYLGGIAGYLSNAKSTTSFVTNCVNYGKVMFSGKVCSELYKGGIIGGIRNSAYSDVKNNANYGTIKSGNNANKIYIGGIGGYTIRTTIENCLSAGIIVNESDVNIGGIAGYNENTNNITHCYWTYDVGSNKSCSNDENIEYIESLYSFNKLDNTTTGTLNNRIPELHSYVALSNWTTLYLNNGTINDLDQPVLVVTQKYFPDPLKKGYTFLYWYVDPEYSQKYDPKSNASMTELYARWGKNINVTLIYRNDGNETDTISAVYGMPYGNLTNNKTKEGHSFIGWSLNETGTEAINCSGTNVAIEENHNLYAIWEINNYTLRFIFLNGTVNEKVLSFNETIEYPNITTIKEDFTFWKWDKDNKTMPAQNLIIRAVLNYTGKGSECVEISFDGKDLTEEDVLSIIHKYTKDDFTIIKLSTTSEDTVVIVKFADTTSATNFVENIIASGDGDNIYVKDISFINGSADSFAPPNFLPIANILSYALF